jgi:hypothetical protein
MKAKPAKRKRKAGKQSLSYEHLLRVNRWEKIVANVLYARSGDMWIGIYYGYSGGDTFDDGVFEVNKHFKVVRCSQEREEFPKKYHSIIQFLGEERGPFEDWSDDTGSGKASHVAIRQVRGQEVDEDGDREYRSVGFDMRVVAGVCLAWPLMFRCFLE